MDAPRNSFVDALRSGSVAQTSPPGTIDYSAWDYPAIKQRLIQLAQTQFGDVYNNLVETDFGVVLLEYLAAQSDFESWKLDYYINEAFLPTALLEKSVRRHARRVGYTPRPKSPARYEFSATLADSYSVDLTVPSGYLLQISGLDAAALLIQLYAADSSGDPIYGQDIVIPAGARSISSIVGIEGEIQSLDATGNGTSFQAFALTDLNVLENYIRVYVDDQEWSKVEALSEVGPELIYRTEWDDRTKQLWVVTGDDVRGAKVPDGSRVRVEYRTGGGARGNVPAGYIVCNQNVVTQETGLAAPVTFSNRTRGRGGDDGETVEEIRRNLPAWYKAQDRLVHLDDYTAWSTIFYSDAGRVAKARAYLRANGCSANIITIYLLEYINDDELIEPSDRLISDLQASIDLRKCATDFVCLKPGAVVSIDLRIFATASQALRTRKSELESRLRAAVDSYFNLSAWNFGKSFSVSALERQLGTVQEIEEIDTVATMDPGYAIVNGAYASRQWELPRPRSIEVNIDFTAA